jgi:hypothetical protein
MRRVLAFLVVSACGGPTQQQLAETPTARTRPVPAEAPPASTSDKDRERAVQQMDDIRDTQRAYRESTKQAPPPPPPKKKGPAESAPMPPKSSESAKPAEEAPPPKSD